MELAGTSAIVTGGASGIGAASARALTKRGARCVLIDLNDELGEAMASELGGLYVKADVANPEQVQVAVDAAAEMAPLRTLVNAAGIGTPGRTVDREGNPLPLEYFEKIIRVNLIGTFNCLRLAAAAMSRTEPVDADGTRGAVVNIASVAAFDGQIGQAAYSASKGGIIGMTLTTARDLSAQGVRGQHDRPRAHRHPDLRDGREGRRLQGQAGGERAVPAPARHGRRVGLDGRRVHHQRLHERRDHPGRRRHPDAPEVGATGG